jgi:hypothetical protein
VDNNRLEILFEFFAKYVRNYDPPCSSRTSRNTSVNETGGTEEEEPDANVEETTVVMSPPVVPVEVEVEVKV